jgi:hypothetical protein
VGAVIRLSNAKIERATELNLYPHQRTNQCTLPMTQTATSNTARDLQRNNLVKELLMTALFVAAGVLAINSTAITTASAGTIYYCKDGTAVSYKSSCKTHGGCCQRIVSDPISRPTGAAGQKLRAAPTAGPTRNN